MVIVHARTPERNNTTSPEIREIRKLSQRLGNLHIHTPQTYTKAVVYVWTTTRLRLSPPVTHWLQRLHNAWRAVGCWYNSMDQAEWNFGISEMSTEKKYFEYYIITFTVGVDMPTSIWKETMFIICMLFPVSLGKEVYFNFNPIPWLTCSSHRWHVSGSVSGLGFLFTSPVF